MYITKIYNYLGKQMNQYTKFFLYNIYIYVSTVDTEKVWCRRAKFIPFSGKRKIL